MKISWPFARKNNKRQQRISLLKGTDCLEMIACKNGEIVASEDIPCADEAAMSTALAAFCEQHDLDAPACTIMLPVSSYQMLLVEAPPVEHAELAEALRWKVKDLLTATVEDSIVDGFLLPDDAYRGRQKMAYTVAAERSPLQSLVNAATNAGVVVDRVEVPELVLLRLLENYPRDNQTEMIVVIGRNKGFLAVIADQSIYLSRSLELSDAVLQAGGDILRDNGPVDHFILEMQRSRDYFESQIGKGVVGRVMLAPLAADASVLVNAIADRLGTKVELMQSTEITTMPLSAGGAEALLLASAAKAA